MPTEDVTNEWVVAVLTVEFLLKGGVFAWQARWLWREYHLAGSRMSRVAVGLLWLFAGITATSLTLALERGLFLATELESIDYAPGFWVRNVMRFALAVDVLATTVCGVLAARAIKAEARARREGRG